MGRDQAAAILGTAHDAYFDVDCEACGGDGALPVDRGPYPPSARKCPNCYGSGKAQMPHPEEVRQAAKILTEPPERADHSDTGEGDG